MNQTPFSLEDDEFRISFTGRTAVTAGCDIKRLSTISLFSRFGRLTPTPHQSDSKKKYWNTDNNTIWIGVGLR